MDVGDCHISLSKVYAKQASQKHAKFITIHSNQDILFWGKSAIRVVGICIKFLAK